MPTPFEDSSFDSSRFRLPLVLIALAYGMCYAHCILYIVWHACPPSRFGFAGMLANASVVRRYHIQTSTMTLLPALFGGALRLQLYQRALKVLSTPSASISVPSSISSNTQDVVTGFAGEIRQYDSRNISMMVQGTFSRSR